MVRKFVLAPRSSMCLRLCLFCLATAMPGGARAAFAATPAPVVVPSGPHKLLIEWDKARSEALAVAAGSSASAVRVLSAEVEGRPVALAFFRGKSGEEAWLGERMKGPAPRLRTLWKGSVGARDADGEVTLRVELSSEGVFRSQEASGIRHCGGEAARLFLERFDFARGAFSPARRPWRGDEATALSPRTSPPENSAWAASGEPFFRFTGASTPATAPGDARTLVRPAALHDGDVATFWPLRQQGPAFATARSAIGVPVLGVVLTAPKAPAVWPARVVLALGAQKRFGVDLSAATGATKVWVVLPSETETACLTIDALPPDEGIAGIAEARVVTALDTVGAAPFVADRVAGGGDCAAGLRLLPQARHIPPASLAETLVARFPSASAAGQSCLLRALLSLPRETLPPPSGWLRDALPFGVRALAKAAGVDRMEQQRMVIAWLEREPSLALSALVQVARDAQQPEGVRATAGRLLAETAGTQMQQQLVEAAAKEAGQPVKVVSDVVAQAPGEWLPVVTQALHETQTPETTAHLLWLLRQRLLKERAPSVEVSAPWVGLAKDAKGPFLIRARAILVLGALPPEVASRPLIEFMSDGDPVVRHLAVQALADLRGSWTQERQRSMRAALDDRDPRVRQTAARAWAKAPQELVVKYVPALTAAHAAERWPFVLSAHVEALAKSCMANPTLVHVLEQTDLPVDVYVVALEGLVSCRSPHVRALALRWLKRQAAPAPVRMAAAQAMGVVGAEPDGEVLRNVLEHLVAQGATDPGADDVAVVVVDTLASLHPAAAVSAAQMMIAANRVRLRQAALVVMGRVCSPEAQAALARHAASADAGLSGAARRALAACTPGGA